MEIPGTTQVPRRTTEEFARRCVREGFSHREISHQLQAKYSGEQL